MPKLTPLRAEDPDRIGRYRLDGRISGLPGAGPFYLAAGPDGTKVAIRLLRGAWTRDAAARDRFAAEAGSARRVPPFCAAPIVDFGAQEDYAFLVSEYTSGRSLLEAVAGSGRLGGLELEALALGGATGLAAVHQAGLVHGSFGPEHVILSQGGPRVIEFGITPPYGTATPAADMLAWAQTMVFASMGRPPATLADLDVLPGVLKEVVAGCLSGDPGFRPEARVVVSALLGPDTPAARALAEGSRRAAQITATAQRAAGGRSASPPGGRPGPAGRGQDGRGLDGLGQDGRGQYGRGQYGRGQDGRGQDGPPGRAGLGQGGQAGHRADRDRAGGYPGGRRVPVAAVSVALVVTAAVGFLVVHLAGNSSTADRAGDGPPANSTSPVSSTDSAAPSPRPSVPASLAGAWQGQVTLGAGTTLDVRISLTAGPGGPDTIAYSSAGSPVCSGELSPQSTAASGALTLSQGIIIGQKKCGNGTVILAGSGSGLSFTFRGTGAPPATATLART